MRAWEVTRPAPIDDAPLELVERREPEPGPGQVRVRIAACGVCRTDLHVSEGDLPVHRPRVVPGHEVVGRVDAAGPGAARFRTGDRVGVAWLAWTCGVCRFCRRGQENFAPAGNLHRLGPRRRLRRVDRGRRTLRLPAPRRPRRRPGRPAAVRGDHRLPGPAQHRAAARRSARHLRFRRLGPHHGPDRPGRGGQPSTWPPARPRPEASPASSEPPGSARPMPALPTPSTPPSTSPRSATSSRGLSRRSTGAGRW